MSGSRTFKPLRPGYGRAGPIAGQAAERICRQAGIHAAMADKRLIGLAQLRLGLDIALRGAEAAREGEFWTHALVAAGFARAICNVALDALDGRIPQPPVGRARWGARCSAASFADPDVFALARLAANDVEAWPGALPADEVSRRIDLVREGIEGGLETRLSLRYAVDEQLGLVERGLQESGDDRLGRIVRAVRELHGCANAIDRMVRQGADGRSAARTALAARTLANEIRAMEGRIKDLQAFAGSGPSPALKALLA